jgi:L-ascorbate metabolism protein UlaG (beta-lactamase superfamily)
MRAGGAVMGSDDATTITWYGHACVEVRTPDGRTILFDPWFGNPKSPKPASAVSACDLLLVTHGHGDHMGEAVELARRLRPAWPTIHECSLWLAPNCRENADNIIGMNKGGSLDVGGIGVTMVGADHSAGDWNPGGVTTLYLGEPAGFVVRVPGGPVLYHAGDTNVFGDMRLIAELYRPTLAFLPIGGHYTMGPREAALAVELLGVDAVAPIHWGTFPILAGTPGELRRELDERGLRGVVVHEWAPGDSIRA